MSRAMNLRLAEAAVIQRCAESAVAISAIETLLSGGTHLVCLTGEGAETMRAVFRDDLIDGQVRRLAYHRHPASR